MPASSDLVQTAAEMRGLIESAADAMEVVCTMTDPVVAKFRENGLFGLMVPKAVGGMEADASTIMDVCEELAYADGSVGWAFAQNCNTMLEFLSTKGYLVKAGTPLLGNGPDKARLATDVEHDQDFIFSQALPSICNHHRRRRDKIGVVR